MFDSRARGHRAIEEVDIFTLMLIHDEISSPTDVQHPPHGTGENSHSRLVDVGETFCCDEQKTQQEYGDYYQCHVIRLFGKVTK